MKLLKKRMDLDALMELAQESHMSAGHTVSFSECLSEDEKQIYSELVWARFRAAICRYTDAKVAEALKRKAGNTHED